MTDLSGYYIQCEQEGSLDDLRVPSMDCQLGKWIATVWDEDNYWYRAKINKIISLTTVELQFVDFGNLISCKKSELYTLVDPFLQDCVPAFSSPAKLFGIKPASGKKFSKAASDLFQRLTQNTDLVGQVIGSHENGKLEVKLSVDDDEIDVGEQLIKERVALPRIRELAGNVEIKIPRNLTNMLDDLTGKLSICKGQNKNSGYEPVLATVKDLQEEINELRKSFLNVDEKSVQVVLKQQVKLAKKMLIIGIEMSEMQDKQHDDEG